VFVNSLADFFEPDGSPVHDHLGNRLGSDVSEEWTQLSDLRRMAFDVMRQCGNLDFLILTKHGLWDGPAGVLDQWPQVAIPDTFGHEMKHEHFKNIWLGVSVSDQKTAARMIPHLVQCQAVCRHLWISYEPATGPVDWYQILDPAMIGDGSLNPVVHWMVIGGESSQPGCTTRPFATQWAAQTIEACRAIGIAPYVKQIGSLAYDTDKFEGRIFTKSKKGGDPLEWPEPIRVRDFPLSV